MFDFHNVLPPQTKQDLFKYINPEQIFYAYFGPFIPKRKVYSSPFRTDKTPSFGFYFNEHGELKCNDLTSGEKLDAIAFVAKKFNISYPKAIQKILFDFNITSIDVDCKVSTFTKKAITFDNNVKKNTKIQIEIRDFSKEELDYWMQWGITRKELIEENVFAYEKAYINKKALYYKKDALKFAFYQKGFEGEGYFKLYQPYKKGYGKWISNIPLSLPFDIDSLPLKSDTLIISKGKKDLLILKKLFTDVIAVQNESLSAILNCITISKQYKRVVVIFDSDHAGVTACTTITNQYGWEYWNTPHYLLENGITDVPEYVSQYGLSVLKTRLQQNKILCTN